MVLNSSLFLVSTCFDGKNKSERLLPALTNSDVACLKLSLVS